jgi:hypothetical protein
MRPRKKGNLMINNKCESKTKSLTTVSVLLVSKEQVELLKRLVTKYFEKASEKIESYSELKQDTVVSLGFVDFKCNDYNEHFFSIERLIECLDQYLETHK